MNDFRPAGSTSAAPSGAAGGDLSGTYPNPTVAKLNGTAAASYALLAGPTFTGTVTLPTGTVNSTMILDGTILNADVNASAAIAYSKLAAGTNNELVGTSNGVTANVKRDFAYLRPTGAIAETFSRNGTQLGNVGSTLTTSVSRMNAIELRAGMVISSITFYCVTTAGSAMTHQWFFLTDSSRVQVATTSDDTSTAWAAGAAKTLNIATIASGASATYTVPSDGMYYVGVVVTGTTTPTLAGSSGGNGPIYALAPILSGTSDTVSTGPASFAKTYGAITGDSKQLWAYVS